MTRVDVLLSDLKQRLINYIFNNLVDSVSRDCFRQFSQISLKLLSFTTQHSKNLEKNLVSETGSKGQS